MRLNELRITSKNQLAKQGFEEEVGMNFYAIIIGESEHHARTLTSVEKFIALQCKSLSEIDFHSLSDGYVIFVKNGDSLSPYVKQYLTLNTQDEKADILYSDEAMFCKNKHKSFPFYKPDYSPEMILSYNYFGNLLCVKTSLLKTIEKLESKSYANFLYEIVLNVLPKSKTILHIDEVLYYSYGENKEVTYQDFYKNFDQEAGHELLKNYCLKNNVHASVIDGRYHGTYRVKYDIIGEPLVSIIIPFRDKPELLETCVNSILAKSTYKNFEIIGVNNGSVERQTLSLIQTLEAKDERVKFHDLDIPFNYSKLNNDAANKIARGEHLVFLNNDTEVIEPSWIEALLEHSQRDDVGVVGAKLLYPDNTLQHCGVILNNHLLRHAHRCLPDHESGYFYFPHISRNYHVVTFACAMMKTSLFKKVNGLNEKLIVAHNDVDICARISALGYYNVYTPYAVLYHYESKSRGLDDTPEKDMLARWEQEFAIKQTPALFVRDSFYSRHLTERETDFSEKIPDTLKGLIRLFIIKFRRRCHELGFQGVLKRILNRHKKLLVSK